MAWASGGGGVTVAYHSKNASGVCFDRGRPEFSGRGEGATASKQILLWELRKGGCWSYRQERPDKASVEKGAWSLDGGISG